MKNIYNDKYNGATINSFYRTLSDIYSNQFCDKKEAMREAIKFTNGRCLYCGTFLYNVDMNGNRIFKDINWDHLYPASYLNLFTRGNVVLSCVICNNNKSDKDPIQFYQELKKKKSSLLFEKEEDFVYEINQFREMYRKDFPDYWCLNKIENINKELLLNTVKIIDLEKTVVWHKTSNKDFFVLFKEYIKKRFPSSSFNNISSILNDFTTKFQVDLESYKDKGKEFYENYVIDYLRNIPKEDYADKRKFILILLFYLDENFTKKIQKEIPYNPINLKQESGETTNEAS